MKTNLYISMAALTTILSTALVCRSDQNEEQLEDYVRVIAPYDVFQKVYGDVANPPDLTSRKNYDIYIEILVKEYRQSFSLDEMQELAKFFGSPVGKKFLQHSLESQAMEEFFSKVDMPEIWTCADHPQVQQLKEGAGECPICGKRLVKIKQLTMKEQHSNREKKGQ